MRVCIIALSTGNAMGQYLEGLLPELSNLCEVFLIAPEKNKLDLVGCSISYVNTGKSKKETIINFLNPRSYKSIINRIAEIKPDIVHIFNAEGYPWNMPISNFCKVSNIPLVVTIHDPVPHPHSIIEFLNGYFRKRVVKNANAIHIHNQLFIPVVEERLKIDSDKIYIIPHGSIAGRYLKYKQNLKKENIVLFFGRVEKYKGLEYLIEAMKLVEPAFKLIIAGAGKLPANIDSLEDRVCIKNYYISEEEAASLFEISKVLVLPYIQASQSSLPQIAKEFNLPTIGTNVGALGIEIAANGGVVVPPKDTLSLSEAIRSMVDDNRNEQTKNEQTHSHSLEFVNIAPLFSDMYTQVIKNADIF